MIEAPGYTATGEVASRQRNDDVDGDGVLNYEEQAEYDALGING